MLARNRAMNFRVQVIAEGGEDTLHKHPATDAVWYVLGGEASFYGEGDKLIAKLGKNQGLLIPHDSPYWFGSSGDDNLVILRFAANVDAEHDDTIQHLAEPKYTREQGASGSRMSHTRVIEGRYFGDQAPA